MIAMEQVALFSILTFTVSAVLMISVGSWMSKMLRPHRPTALKTSTYESGEEAVGDAWGQFNIRFYGIAVIFILFEIETIMLFPWATIWANSELNAATAGLWVHYTATSILLFIILLAVGLIYVWRQGHLATPKRLRSSTPHLIAKVPKGYYDQINERYAGPRAPQ